MQESHILQTCIITHDIVLHIRVYLRIREIQGTPTIMASIKVELWFSMQDGITKTLNLPFVLPSEPDDILPRNIICFLIEAFNYRNQIPGIASDPAFFKKGLSNGDFAGNK